MNLSERKTYSYSQNGILMTRFEYKKEVKMYGDPIKTSSNGQNFIFKRSKIQIKELNINPQDKWIFNVMAISMFGIRFIQ